MKNAERYGLPRCDTAPVDFSEVAGRIRSVIETIQKHDSEERFCGLGVKVVFGLPRFTDEHSIRVDGRQYSAQTWVIATGSSPAVPPIDGLPAIPFLTNKEIFSLDRLPKSMITIGAGPTAIELAQAFARLGTKVTVVQRGNQILNAEDPDMAGFLMQLLMSEGIDFYLNSTPVSVRDLGDGKEVVIKTVEETTSLRAETILVAAGRRPNLEGLGIEGLSLETSRSGLVVDARMRTSLRHIYAAGDITGAYQFTHAAGYEGGIVLSNALLHLPRKADYRHFPWVTFTDPELASIGMNEKRASAAGLKYSVWTEEFRMNDRGLTEGEATGKSKLLLDEKDKPIGIQILGPSAGELISEWVAVMYGRMRLSAMATAIHPYPTLGEINKRVVGKYYAGRIFSERVKRALKFFFQLRGRACEL
jgi:pyruvate/2-oxoglutarate dehydrogenase complex dihydrolipoamide dehydrogenase (E3) component